MRFVVHIQPVPEFLSTPSARRATTCAVDDRDWNYISIHALCEEGDRTIKDMADNLFEFLSTPSARRATSTKGIPAAALRFLSTPSARRATVQADSLRHPGAISIHALREEGDEVPMQSRPHRHYFYPRPPRGGRPPAAVSASMTRSFLSTPSARRATNAQEDESSTLVFLSTPSARRATVNSFGLVAG